jgi:hypothetical protein
VQAHYARERAVQINKLSFQQHKDIPWAMSFHVPPTSFLLVVGHWLVLIYM